MNTIGLITYHSAYNFGSVLQTYGTIKTIEDLGYKVETIDYRTPSQTFWYHIDWHPRKGFRNMIVNFGFNLIKKTRKIRAQKFEDFINKFLHPSTKKYVTYEDFKNAPNYPILVSGSDQIWNFYCGEFASEPHEAILPYFLRFGNPRKRIAYASSFGTQTIRNIRKYAEYLKDYDSLSTREPVIRRYLEKVTGREVDLVCDPTWLLSKEEWLKLEGVYTPKTERPYIFVYALNWTFRVFSSWMNAIKLLAKRNGWDVYVISPLTYNSDKEVRMLQDAGPIDFLSYLANAAFVVTNTFHGTIFSINFQRPFFSLTVDAGSRQGQMLKLCDLEDRIILNVSELADASDLSVDFTHSAKELDAYRAKSIEYLKNALKE